MRKKQWIAVIMAAIMMAVMVPVYAFAVTPDLGVPIYACPGRNQQVDTRGWDVPEGGTVEYKIADPGIATIDANGTIVGHKEGNTIIYLTVKDKDGNVVVEDSTPLYMRHAVNFIKSMKQPTCTEPGEIDRYFCPYCDKAYRDEACTIFLPNDEIIVPPRHGETELKNAKAATATAEGYTGDKVCKDCGAVLEQGTVIPKTTSASSGFGTNRPNSNQPDANQSLTNESETQPSDTSTSNGSSQQPAEDAETVVDVSVETIVNKSVFEQAKRAGQDLVLKGTGYSWKFSKETLAETEYFPDAFDARISFGDSLSKKDQDELGSLVGESEYLGFRFAYHGELLGKAEITLSLEDVLNGKDVVVYSVSDSGEAIEEAETTVTADGTLKFETEHCSLWFVSEKNAAETETSESGGWVWIIVIVVIAVAAVGIVCWWFFTRKNKFRIK